MSIVLAFISIGLYVQLAYFTPRAESALLISCFTLLFAFYLMLSKSVLSFKTLLVFGIVYRLLFVFSTPALSDDFYRFFWDGLLIVNRINPFQYLPKEIIENPAINIPEINAGLYTLLNSPEYYTVYPPICQFIFWISAWISGGNIYFAVLSMKIIFMMAELGSIYLIWNLLKIHQGKKELTLLYMLNPLVIVELVGNIHFEAIMIFAVLLAAYAIAKHKVDWGSIWLCIGDYCQADTIAAAAFFAKEIEAEKNYSFLCCHTDGCSFGILAFFG
jgi:alpha-1,6-mannosyltransferase